MGKPCYPNMPHKTEDVKYEQKILPVFEQKFNKERTPVFDQSPVEEEKITKGKKKK